MARKKVESSGTSRGTRASDYEKSIKGSDKSPAEQKKAPKTSANSKLVRKYKSAAKAVEQRAAHARGESPLAMRRAARAAKTVGKVGKLARGGIAGAIVGGAAYLGSKIKGAYEENKKTLSKLESDARNEKPKAPAVSTPKKSAPAKQAVAPTKKYGTTLAGIKKTKGGDYAVYKKGSSDSKEFQNAYRSAKKGATFEWRGRKYKKP